MYLLGQIVAKGLTEMGRMVKIFILLTDKPGALKEVVDQISSLSVNIVDVIHDRLSSSIPAGTAGVTLSLETQDQEHAEQLIKFLKKKNMRPAIHRPAAPRQGASRVARWRATPDPAAAAEGPLAELS